VLERVRLPLWCRTSERAREGEEREAVNGGQGRRVLTGQGAAGSACAPGKKPGKLFFFCDIGDSFIKMNRGYNLQTTG
jgi:hypothetical protein